MSEEEKELDKELGTAQGEQPPQARSVKEVADTESEFEADAVARAQERGFKLDVPLRTGEEPAVGEPLAEPRAPEAAPKAEPKAEEAAEPRREPPPENRIGELERRLQRADRDREADRALMLEQHAILQEMLKEREADRQPAGPPTVAGLPLPQVAVPEQEITDYDGMHRSTARALDTYGQALQALHREFQDYKNQRQEEDRLKSKADLNRRYVQEFAKLEKHVPAEREEQFWGIVRERGILPENLTDALLILERDRLMPIVTAAPSPARQIPPTATLVTEGGSAQRGASEFRPLSLDEYDRLSEVEKEAYQRRYRAHLRERASQVTARVGERLQE